MESNSVIEVQDQDTIETNMNHIPSGEIILSVVVSVIVLLLGKNAGNFIKLIYIIGQTIQLGEKTKVVRDTKIDDWLIAISKEYLARHPELGDEAKLIKTFENPKTIVDLIESDPKDVLNRLSK